MVQTRCRQAHCSTGPRSRHGREGAGRRSRRRTSRLPSSCRALWPSRCPSSQNWKLDGTPLLCIAAQQQPASELCAIKLFGRLSRLRLCASVARQRWPKARHVMRCRVGRGAATPAAARTRGGGRRVAAACLALPSPVLRGTATCQHGRQHVRCRTLKLRLAKASAAQAMQMVSMTGVQQSRGGQGCSPAPAGPRRVSTTGRRREAVRKHHRQASGGAWAPQCRQASTPRAPLAAMTTAWADHQRGSDSLGKAAGRAGRMRATMPGAAGGMRGSRSRRAAIPQRACARRCVTPLATSWASAAADPFPAAALPLPLPAAPLSCLQPLLLRRADLLHGQTGNCTRRSCQSSLQRRRRRHQGSLSRHRHSSPKTHRRRRRVLPSSTRRCCRLPTCQRTTCRQSQTRRMLRHRRQWTALLLLRMAHPALAAPAAAAWTLMLRRRHI